MTQDSLAAISSSRFEGESGGWERNMNRTASKCELAGPSGVNEASAGASAIASNENSRLTVIEPQDVRESLREYILAGAKLRADHRCGAELELFGFDASSNQRLDHQQVQFTLRALAHDPGSHNFDGGTFAGAKLDLGGNLTVEPGGQLEYSTAPHRDLMTIESELNSYLSRLKDVSRSSGSRFLAIGFDPLRTVGEQHWFPKPRYDIMRPYMAGRGSRAWDMMTRTCATQVSLDFTSEADLVRKFVVGNRLAPYVTAMFANSPFADGVPSGYKSTRAGAWLDTDPDRCGAPGLIWSGEFTVDAFIEYALDIPMLFRRRDGDYLRDLTGTTFREYLEVEQSTAEIEADWADHLTTIFTEARVKQVIELRSADSGSMPLVMALQALWKGMLYDEETLDQVERLIPNQSPVAFRELQVAVARDGLQAETIGVSVLGRAQELVRLAAAGLGRIAPYEVKYLDILQQQVIDEALSPADILLRNWHGTWHGSMESVFDYVSIA
jgi:glutamate--cysteine ligase